MTESANPKNIDYSFIRGGLLHHLFTKVGLAQPGLAGVRLRAGWVILLTYITTLVLALIQGVAWDPTLRLPFLFDIAETCRYLLVGPLLIVSEAIVEPWLVQMVRQTRDRLIQKEELPRFEKLIARSIRWRDSYIVEILLFLSTFGWQWLEVRVLPQPAAASWHQLPSSGAPTYAFLWCLYLAKPLVRFLWLRWIWRYLLWSFLLIRLSSFQLKIAPEYPDRHGGLEFIAIAHGRFAALALTFAAQVASIFGEQILFEGRTLASFRYEIIGVVVIVLLTLLTPLLAFTGKLLVAKRIALLDYGMLADQYTSAFHARWIHGARGSEQILGTPDIQSLADLDNSYQIVRGMNISLISKDIILTFVVATLLPFVPLLLIVYPLDELIKHLLKAVI